MFRDSSKNHQKLKFFIMHFSWIDVICGYSLVGSKSRSAPVSQALSPYKISSHYLKPLESSGSDTMKRRRVRFGGKWKLRGGLEYSSHQLVFFCAINLKLPQFIY
jgi:hypothetical protein